MIQQRLLFIVDAIVGRGCPPLKVTNQRRDRMACFSCFFEGAGRRVVAKEERKHMDGIFSPLITRNFIRLWQPFPGGAGWLWACWAAHLVAPCMVSCHPLLLLSAHFVHNCRVACFVAWSSGRDLSNLLFVCFLSSFSLPLLFFPLLSVGVGACEPTFCGWLQGAELMLSGVHDDYTVECEDGSLSHPLSLLFHSR